jgi:hypothetical protein
VDTQKDQPLIPFVMEQFHKAPTDCERDPFGGDCSKLDIAAVPQSEWDILFEMALVTVDID